MNFKVNKFFLSDQDYFKMFPRYLYPAVTLLMLPLIIIIAKTARNSCNQCISHYLSLAGRTCIVFHISHPLLKYISYLLFFIPFVSDSCKIITNAKD